MVAMNLTELMDLTVGPIRKTLGEIRLRLKMRALHDQLDHVTEIRIAAQVQESKVTKRIANLRAEMSDRGIK